MALKKVGALWKKSDKKGQNYLSGSLDLGALGEATIMVFKNEKSGKNQPDYTVHLVLPEKEAAAAK